MAVEITTTIAARKARDDVKQLAEDVMRARLDLAREGMPQSKQAPFGYDKLYHDRLGQHLWTTHLLDNGRYLVINPDGSTVERERSPRKTKSDRIKYVPSRDHKRVELVRTIFETYANEAISERQIALRLNQSGRLHYGKPWIRTTLLELLRNPAYIGSVRNLGTQQAEFATFDGEKISTASIKDRKTTKTPDRAIIIPDKHDAIIDPVTWAVVQKKLKTRKSRRQPPRREDLWLRGVLICGLCQQPMHTFTGNKKKAAHVRGYICSSYYYYYNQTHAEKYATGCPRSFISHQRAEELIQAKLGELRAETANTDELAVLELRVLSLRAKTEEIILKSVITGGIAEYFQHISALLNECGQEAALERITNKIQDMEGIKGTKKDLIALLAAKDDLFNLETFQKYFILFEEEKTAAARSKADALKSEYDTWVKAKVHASSERERERINGQLHDLDAEISKWEGLTVPLDEQLAEVRSRLDDYRNKLVQTARVLIVDPEIGTVG